MRANLGSVAELEDLIEEGGLPRCYYDHPVVRRSARGDPPVYPANVFVDGVAYSHTDTVIGFWIISVLTGRRMLFAVLRKRLFCE